MKNESFQWVVRSDNAGKPRRHRVTRAAVFAVMFAASLATACGYSAMVAAAPNYPDHPITMIVPNTPSGGMDTVARKMAQKMGEILKTSIIVENKAGAGGNIGAMQVARSAPDGYTILLGQTAQFAINPHIYPAMSFDPATDLVPVVMLSDAPNVIVVGSASPFHSLDDIVAAAKASAQPLNFATPGVGTPSHLIGVMFQKAAGITLVHVPYKGASSAITDTIAGRTAFMMSSVPSSLPLIRSGKLRAIAVSARTRSAVLPDVPTIAEAGYKGFQAGTWYGLFVPAGTPAPVVQRLNDVANEALRFKDVEEFITTEGGNTLGGSKEVFASRIQADSETLGKAVRDANAKLD